MPEIRYYYSIKMEHNQTQFFEFDNDFTRIAVIIMAVTMAVALIGNSILLVIIWKSSKSKALSSVQLLILNNGVADILFALLTILPTCAEFLVAPRFYGNDIICRMIAYMRLVPMYASPFLLIAISRDRYKAICQPLRTLRHAPGERAKRYAAMSWFFALSCALPNLVIYGLYKNDQIQVNQCRARFGTEWLAHTYVLCFCSAAWIIPSTLSGYFYFRVCYCVWNELTGIKTSISCKEMGRSSAEKAGITEDRSKRPRLSNTCVIQIREFDRQKMHTIKLTMTIVLFNFILWAPFCITNIIHVFWSDFIDPIVSTCIILLGNLNSCVNPWIYVYFQWKQIKMALVNGSRSRAASYSYLSKQRTSESERGATVRKITIDTVVLSRIQRQYSVDQEYRKEQRVKLIVSKGRSVPEGMKTEIVYEEDESQINSSHEDA